MLIHACMCCSRALARIRHHVISNCNNIRYCDVCAFVVGTPAGNC